MTEFEFAKFIETTDLTNGVVVYDKNGVIVVAKSILTHPDCIQEHNFLFIIDKRARMRIGAIMDLIDDIQIYIKPDWRGEGYASLLMREVVPYWMPGLVSITSSYKRQDAKIKHLAACANMKVRKSNLTLEQARKMERASEKRVARTLSQSSYARALASAYTNPKGLLDCPDKVTNPRRLRKNITTPDIDFIEDWETKNRINCQAGNIMLPKTKLPCINLKDDSVQRIYTRMAPSCLVEAFEENNSHYIELTPFSPVDMQCTDEGRFTDRLDLSFVRLDRDMVYVSFSAPFNNAHQWFKKHALPQSNTPTNKYEAHYDWGYVDLEDNNHVNFVFQRKCTERDIMNIINKNHLPIHVL